MLKSHEIIYKSFVFNEIEIHIYKFCTVDIEFEVTWVSDLIKFKTKLNFKLKIEFIFSNERKTKIFIILKGIKNQVNAKFDKNGKWNGIFKPVCFYEKQ